MDGTDPKPKTGFHNGKSKKIIIINVDTNTIPVTGDANHAGSALVSVFAISTGVCELLR
jgi:hypothetical protein